MVELGDFQLSLVSDGGFRLDGGAMFGVVPRTLWEKRCPPDERNRIRMATNCLLVERGRDLLLIDTGIGDKHDEKFQSNYGMEVGAARPTRLPESIRPAGVVPVRFHQRSRARTWSRHQNDSGAARRTLFSV